MSLVDGIDVIHNITNYGNQFDEWKLDIPFERCTLIP
jgi:hypothetical protein